MLNIKKAASWNSTVHTTIPECQGHNLNSPEELFQIFQVMKYIFKSRQKARSFGLFLNNPGKLKETH